MGKISKKLERAIALHQSGDFQKAASAYKTHLEREPADANCLYLLGTLMAQTDRFLEAVELLDQADKLRPFHPAILQSRGNSYLQLNRLTEAHRDLTKALAIDPNNTSVLYALGQCHSRNRELEQSFFIANKLLAIDPENQNGFFLKLSLLAGCDQTSEFKDLFDKCLESFHLSMEHITELLPLAIKNLSETSKLRLLAMLAETKPKDNKDKLRRAKAYLLLNMPNQAENDLISIAESNERNESILQDLSLMLETVGNTEQAIEQFQKLLKENARSAAHYTIYAFILKSARRYKEAIISFNKALRLDPKKASAYSGKAEIYRTLRKYKKALINYGLGVNADQDFKPAVAGLYECLFAIKAFEEALRALELSEQKFGKDPEASLTKLYTKLKIAHWDSYEQDLEDLRKLPTTQRSQLSPFRVLGVIDDPYYQLSTTQSWAEKNFHAFKQQQRKHIKKSKIRIGYFGSEFKRHPVSYLSAGLFELYNRDEFEVIAICVDNYIQDSDYRIRIAQATDKFANLSGLSLRELLKKCEELDLDIAVDLDGYTARPRTQIFAQRIAPIQINYLGYPGTMGANFMDYIVADKIVIPEGSEKFYAEKIIFMPSCYQANDDKRHLPSLSVSKPHFELPKDSFVYCCFNNFYKITPQMFSSWMRILKRTRDSILWLMHDNDVGVENMKQNAAARGIDPSRLVFAPPLSMEDHLDRISVADLALDTLPYNAHTTGSDSLWAGVPMITCPGASFASRVGASLLMAVDLPELITKDLEEYENLATSLAKNPELIQSFKDHLRQKRYQLPLFDSRKFTKDLELGFKEIYKLNLLNKPPAHIDIKCLKP